MEYLKKAIEKEFSRLYNKNHAETRRIVLHTGAGGYDLFDEALDRELGVGRIYVNRLPRIISKYKKLHTSAKGKNFVKYKLTDYNSMVE